MPTACRWSSHRGGSAVDRCPSGFATTDLFHDVAKLPRRAGRRFYMLGATERPSSFAVQRALSLYPRLRICGHHSGLFHARAGAETSAKINAAGPDTCGSAWASRAKAVLRGAQSPSLPPGGIITDSWPVRFSFRQESRARTGCKQRGLEWRSSDFLSRKDWPAATETNPHAAFLLLTRTRQLRFRSEMIDAR